MSSDAVRRRNALEREQAAGGPVDEAQRLAARFAAKEAASKAFGTGIGAELALTSVGVLNGPEGEPVVELDDKARALLTARGASRLLLSLTHTDTLAQAFVVLVR
jgi:holo-[acyl-carrier protein] synthase